MLFGKKEFYLVPLTGPQVAQEFILSGDRITIGSEGSGADIALVGSDILAEHAVLNSVRRGWQLQALRRGTILVNGQPAKRRLDLRKGDRLEFGGSLILEVYSREAKAEPGKSRAGGAHNAKLIKYLPVIVLNVVIIGAIMLVESRSKNEGLVPLDQTDISAFIKADIAALISGDGVAIAENGEIVPLDLGDRGLYDEILIERSKGSGPEILDPLGDALQVKLEQRFFDAWLYEKLGHWDAAIETYSQIEELFPDPRVKSTSEALRRMRRVERISR